MMFFVLSIGFMAAFLLEIGLFSTLFSDINTNSKLPFSGPQN